MQRKLSSEELKILLLLTTCPSARFCKVSGSGSIYLYLCKGRTAMTLPDEYRVYHLEVPKAVVTTLDDLWLIVKESSVGSCFASIWGLNLLRLSRFEETKELAIQLALGTGYQNSDEDFDHWGDLPG